MKFVAKAHDRAMRRQRSGSVWTKGMREARQGRVLERALEQMFEWPFEAGSKNRQSIPGNLRTVSVIRKDACLTRRHWLSPTGADGNAE